MVATYGTTAAAGRLPPVPERRGAQSTLRVLVLGMGIAIVGMVAAASLVQHSAPRRVELEPIPAAVQDLQNFVDVDAAKSWVKDTFTNAQTHQALHPMSNLDPFTNQPVAPGDYESMLRAHATKAITDQVHSLVTAEIADAQQSARDWSGADAGCTHEELNQTDYNGPVAAAVTGQACLPWADALTLGYNAYDPLLYPELVANECRNPNADRIGSWCYLAGITAGQPDVEGTTWEYCDIGKRCKIDMPLLHAKHTSTLKPVVPGATLKPANGQVLARKGEVPSGLLKYKLSRKEGRSPHSSSRFHQQQLAAVPVQAAQSRDMYSWDDGISTKEARARLADNGWFMMDRGAPRGVDTGIEQGISGKGARRSVDKIWK